MSKKLLHKVMITFVSHLAYFATTSDITTCHAGYYNYEDNSLKRHTPTRNTKPVQTPEVTTSPTPRWNVTISLEKDEILPK
ncbi:MAG: hypothetical protein K2Q34_06810, partial [Alphaproteobacteria bacterium]|nr:hypothetical protein [Alphaproteobacteria bacterium]